MAGLATEGVRVSDLRGSAVTVPRTAVLEDPSGRRRRRLRVLSRAIAAVLTFWLVALVLGGIGLSPVPGVPFARLLGPSAPPAAKRHVTPAQPSAADLRPALTERAVTTASAAAPASATTRTAAQHGTTAPATTRPTPPRKRTAPRTVAPPASTTLTTPARATPAPGGTTHPNNGRGGGTTTSTTTTTTTTTGTTTSPGRSGSAPGQTGTSPGHTKTTASP